MNHVKHSEVSFLVGPDWDPDRLLIGTRTDIVQEALRPWEATIRATSKGHIRRARVLHPLPTTACATDSRVPRPGTEFGGWMLYTCTSRRLTDSYRLSPQCHHMDIGQTNTQAMPLGTNHYTPLHSKRYIHQVKNMLCSGAWTWRYCFMGEPDQFDQLYV